MSAGLHPANSLNHLKRDSGIPLDSIGSADALARARATPLKTSRSSRLSKKLPARA